MNFKHRLALLAIMATGFASCKKSDVPVTSDNSSGIAFKLQAVNPSSPLARAAGTDSQARELAVTIHWISATANVNLLKFEATKNGAEVEFKSNVHRFVDLFNVDSAIGNINITPGVYNEVEFKAQLVGSNNNHSIALKGQVVIGGTTTNVSFSSDENVEIKAEKNNVTISNLHDAITNIDLSAITQGISASSLSAAVLTNGELVISSSVNAAIYARIIRNLRDLEHGEDFH